jgi:uncharacterized repeat protein (TIGR01451 family)
MEHEASMFRATLLRRLLLLVAFVAATLPSASAQFQLPAIDPSGQHVFNGTTTFAHDGPISGLFHKNQAPTPIGPPIIAAPAVPAAPAAPIVVAPVKPPCTPPVEAVPIVPVVPVVPQPIIAVPQGSFPVTPPPTVIPSPPGPELRITPARIVAPVNTEVVLAAGICSPDGYYVTRQPLEWMLAQDGVGQIVAVGHESPHNTSYLLRNSPQKLATNYVRAHTSTISQVLNRGTPNPADDVYLHKGQSWISVTSPTEGTTNVVVWAPKEQNWDRRKATAVIQWVNAGWRLPPNATSRAGQACPLMTTVSRASGEPVSGWIVRYEVIDGPPAGFNRGAPAVEVRTDAAGRAVAQLLPASAEPGITTVRVQIVSPAQRNDQPQMVVGQGVSAVHWTIPGLTVRAMGTSAALADGAVAYRVEVTNGGDLVTHDAALSYTPPTGVTVLNSTPAGQPFGQRLVWRLGDLPPGTSSVIELNCRAKVPGAVRSSFVATSAEVPKAEHEVATDVRVNALAVKMAGPETAEVGREAKFLIDITNIGGIPLENIAATDTFEPGLSHAGGERSPLVKTIPILTPGQTERFAISFVVTQPGRQLHRLDVTADGGHGAGARAAVTGIAPIVSPPQLAVRVVGPPSRRAGEVAQYSIEVKNNGAAPAASVDLAVTWGSSLEVTEATRGHIDDLARSTTRWRISHIAAGETVTRQLNCRCRAADQNGAPLRATVSSEQTPTTSNQLVTVITPATAVGPRAVPVNSGGGAPGGAR